MLTVNEARVVRLRCPLQILLRYIEVPYEAQRAVVSKSVCHGTGLRIHAVPVVGRSEDIGWAGRRIKLRLHARSSRCVRRHLIGFFNHCTYPLEFIKVDREIY